MNRHVASIATVSCETKVNNIVKELRVMSATHWSRRGSRRSVTHMTQYRYRVYNRRVSRKDLLKSNTRWRWSQSSCASPILRSHFGLRCWEPTDVLKDLSSLLVLFVILLEIDCWILPYKSPEKSLSFRYKIDLQSYHLSTVSLVLESLQLLFSGCFES